MRKNNPDETGKLSHWIDCFGFTKKRMRAFIALQDDLVMLKKNFLW